MLDLEACAVCGIPLVEPDPLSSGYELEPLCFDCTAWLVQIEEQAPRLWQ